jgi:hypothetical protein
MQGSETKARNYSTALYITLVFLVGLVVAFVMYYIMASGRIVDANEQIATQDTQILTLQGQVSSLENQLESANNQVIALQVQLSTADVQTSLLEGQISDLQSILALSQSSVKASSVTINQAAGEASPVVVFVADYAGYIVVSGNSTTTNGYIVVADSFSGYPYNSTPHSFGTDSAWLIPVLPGTVSVYFGNTNLINGATATLSVTYYY